MHKFTLPKLPASQNAIYNILFSLKRVEMKPEVRLWKTEMKEYIPPWKVPEGGLWITLVFYGNWHTKAGKVKTVDLPNLIKVTVDVIAEKLGFNDSLIFEMRNLRKIQSTDEKIEVELGVI